MRITIDCTAKEFRNLLWVAALLLIITIPAFIVAQSDHTPEQTIMIDCGAGEIIGQVLANASAGDTLVITGTCSEMVTIAQDGITLDGQGSAVIDGGGGFAIDDPLPQGVITIEGSRGVTIQGLTVQNGPDGIRGIRGSNFTVRNVNVRNNADRGIEITQQSSANIIDTTVEDNGDDGIIALFNSHISLRGTVSSTGNRDSGLNFFGSSSGSIFNATVKIIGNGRSATFGIREADGFISGDGVRVQSASTLSISNSTLEVMNNADDGISVGRSSDFVSFNSVDLNAAPNAQPSTTIIVEGNGQLNEFGDGVIVFNSSSFVVSGSQATFVSRSNMGRGIGVFDSNISCSRAMVTITGNGTEDFIEDGMCADSGVAAVAQALANRSFAFSDSSFFDAGLTGLSATLEFFGNFVDRSNKPALNFRLTFNDSNNTAISGTATAGPPFSCPSNSATVSVGATTIHFGTDLCSGIDVALSNGGATITFNNGSESLDFNF